MNHVRKATIDDLESLSRLFDAYRVFYEKISDLEAAKDFLKARIENNESVIFVASNETQNLIGFTQLYPLFSSTRMKKLWLLNDLFVLPDTRGQGVSVQLIEAAKKHCRQTNACGLVLETAKTNTVGNNLYPKTDFVLDTDYNHFAWNV